MIFNMGSGGASSADKVKYDNTKSDLSSDNVQDAIDEINNKLIKMDLLWTNPNPLNVFNSSQTVNVDLTDYDYVGLVVNNNSSSIVTSPILILRKTAERQSAGGLAIGGSCWNRIVNSITNNGINFGQGTNGLNDNNANAIPYKIYGIKF